MAWLFPDKATLQTTELLKCLSSDTALVPSCWVVEVTNVIAIAERKSRITLVESATFIAHLGTPGFEHDDQGPARAFANLLPICRAHHLTSYDALYLDLAVRRHLPLATLDEPLRKAAKKLGVELLGK